MKSDLDSSANIKRFIDLFYDKVLADEMLSPIFVDVAGINIEEHKSVICSYWEKLLLGDKRYRRHTMNIHRAVNEKHPFKAEEFARWLHLFTETVDEDFEGEKAQRAKQVARSIAANMENAFR